MRSLKAVACLIIAIALVYLPFFLLELFPRAWWALPTMIMCGATAMMMLLIGFFFAVTWEDD